MATTQTEVTVGAHDLATAASAARLGIAVGTAPAPVSGSAEAGNERRYINRELSWLDFNSRVLDLAEDQKAPLLERCKVLAIFSSNLDEFFRFRVAALRDQLAAGLSGTDPAGLSPSEQLKAIRRETEGLIERRA